MKGFHPIKALLAFWLGLVLICPEISRAELAGATAESGCGCGQVECCLTSATPVSAPEPMPVSWHQTEVLRACCWMVGQLSPLPPVIENAPPATSCFASAHAMVPLHARLCVFLI